VNFARIDPVTSRELFIRHALVEGDWESRHHFFRDNAAAIAEAAGLEQRMRRRGLVAGEDALFAFYDARVPSDVVSARHFDAWWKKARHATPKLLTLRLEDLLSDEAAAAGTEAAYPGVWTSASPGASGDGQRISLPVSYAFEPGTEVDGVTIDIPLKTLNQARPEEFSWQVPGLREELVTELIRTLPKALRRELVPAPNMAREVLARVGEQPPGDVRETLARELLRLRGVRIPLEAFDLDKLPPHLRITFRVVDHSRVIGTGKDLATLQRQLRPKLRATLSARAGALTRTGLTSWDFGELPQVFADGEVTAYPALTDTGQAVDIRLFETQEAAREAMRAGTRRLILLGARSPVKDIAARLGTQSKLTLSNNPHGSVAALFADCVNCAADGLIAGAGGPAWDAGGFEKLSASVRSGLQEATAEVVRRTEGVLRSAHAAGIRLDGLRSPVLAPAADDIRKQLRGLVYPGFLAAAGSRRLPALTRYLQAIERRLDKLPDNPGRDAQLMEIVHRAEHAYRDVAAHAGAADIRWMIEELRVSLFAQAIGTPVPVSERRILAAIEHLN
jgi:ATP-dependent helicase HrpA